MNQKTEKSRENMHNAATLAGMSFANAFLGICHSLAHKLGQKFHIPHGLANAICLPRVIEFNATDVPTKMGTFPQYKYPVAIKRYAEVADYCGLTKPGQSDAEKVKVLVNAIYDLYKKIGVSPYIKDFKNAPSKQEYFDSLDYLAEQAFDDQCTGANPRYPLIPELKAILEQIYE